MYDFLYRYKIRPLYSCLLHLQASQNCDYDDDYKDGDDDYEDGDDDNNDDNNDDNGTEIFFNSIDYEA
jgi:hypothetical protein